MPMYTGIDGTLKELPEWYEGIDGVKHKVTQFPVSIDGAKFTIKLSSGIEVTIIEEIDCTVNTVNHPEATSFPDTPLPCMSRVVVNGTTYILSENQKVNGYHQTDIPVEPDIEIEVDARKGIGNPLTPVNLNGETIYSSNVKEEETRKSVILKILGNVQIVLRATGDFPYNLSGTGDIPDTFGGDQFITITGDAIATYIPSEEGG